MRKPRYIPRTTWDRELEHVACREKLASDKSDKSDKPDKPDKLKIFEYLYQRLSILDTKVAVLLTVNSVLLAAISVAGSRIDKVPSARWVFLIGTPIWLLSTVICLSISFLRWEHMHNVTSSRDHYLGKLIKVTIRRSFLYNIAVALILVLVPSLAIWAMIVVAHDRGHPQDKAGTGLTLILKDKSLALRASNPAYDLEHIGKVGPFVIGEHQAISEKQTDGFITLNDLCQSLTNRSSNNVEIESVILAGKADKREPTSAVRQKYGSNLNLAQQRARSVKQALVSNPSLRLDSNKVITVISGADVLKEDSKNGATFESDRGVECYAVFKNARSK